MHILWVSLVTYASLVLDAGCGAWSLPPAILPSFLLLSAALATSALPGTMAVLWVSLIGLMQDVVSGGPLGMHVVLLANLTFLTQLLTSRKAAASLFTRAAFILVYVALGGLGGQLLRDVLTGHQPELLSQTMMAVSRAGGSAAVYLVVAPVRLIGTRLVGFAGFSRVHAFEQARWAR